ncbi:microneme protein [Cyclospora cayetanensis]|uniref:Microneme protein n=1 Tax=Cyclospora cayetanensis TaxID=88456 RepID=A0A1D3D763_9EIME|nr:microneme protein [Cyclospora cayetanensis]
MYARHDVAKGGISKEWRCYAQAALNTASSSPNCIDTCGSLRHCLGAYGGFFRFYLTRNDAMEENVTTQKAKFCISPAPSLQKILDRLCMHYTEERCEMGVIAECVQVAYARFDKGTASQAEKQ